MSQQTFPLKRLRYMAGAAMVIAAIAGSICAALPRYEQRLSASVTRALGSRASHQFGHGNLALHYVDAFELNVSLPLRPGDSKAAVFAFGKRTESAKTIAINDTAELSNTFQRMGYRLNDPEEGAVEVPRLIVTKLPRDLSQIDEPDWRKMLFFEMTLPLILQANEAILEQRDRVIALRANLEEGEPIAGAERHWLDQVEAYYSVESDDFGELLNRIDVVPPSLALAQAAIESGWGTSRYALEGNALFGQYTTDHSVGLRPDALADDAEIRIRAFSGLLEAVFSYARNLNTHPAYRAFRSLRAKQRGAGDTPDGFVLARTLTRYSTRGEDYIRDVQAVIRANELDFLDDASLKDSEVTRVVPGNT